MFVRGRVEGAPEQCWRTHLVSISTASLRLLGVGVVADGAKAENFALCVGIIPLVGTRVAGTTATSLVD